MKSLGGSNPWKQSNFVHKHSKNGKLCVCACSCVRLLRLHGLWPARLLCPWDFPGKSTAVCCHFLLQGDLPNLVIKSASLNFMGILPQLKKKKKDQALTHALLPEDSKTRKGW